MYEREKRLHNTEISRDSLSWTSYHSKKTPKQFYVYNKNQLNEFSLFPPKYKTFQELCFTSGK